MLERLHRYCLFWFFISAIWAFSEEPKDFAVEPSMENLPASEEELAEKLRQLDLYYRSGLEAIYRHAKVRDFKALMADIERREKVTATLSSKPAKPPIRKLEVTATANFTDKPGQEFHFSAQGVRAAMWNRINLKNIEINGELWEPRWETAGYRLDTSEWFSVDVHEILKIKTAGPIRLKKVFRGTGVTAFQVVPKSRNSLAAFGIQVLYRSSE